MRPGAARTSSESANGVVFWRRMRLSSRVRVGGVARNHRKYRAQSLGPPPLKGRAKKKQLTKQPQIFRFGPVACWRLGAGKIWDT